MHHPVPPAATTRAPTGRWGSFSPPSRLALTIVWLALAVPAGAQRLAVKSYTTADGLAHDTVRVIAQDRRGFLWFGTTEGLSRFDGYRFSTMGTAEGLPNPYVTGILDDEDGGRWIATRGGGVARFDAAGRVRRVYAIGQRPGSNRVMSLFRDREGRLWAGTQFGAYVLRSAGGEFEMAVRGSLKPVYGSGEVWVWSFAEDRQGAIWIGTNEGLMRWRDGREVEESAGERIGIPGPAWAPLLVDAEGRLWGGGVSGLWSLMPPAESEGEPEGKGEGHRRTASACEVVLSAGTKVRPPSVPGEACRYHPAGGGRYEVTALLEARDGTLWVATARHGLLNVGPQGVRQYTTADRLIDDSLTALFEDRDGNVWAGAASGVMRLQRSGFVTYGPGDGLEDPHVVALAEDGGDGVCAMGSGDLVQCLHEGRWRGLRLPIAAPVAHIGYNQLFARDRRGAWWVRAPDGLYSFPVGDPVMALQARPRLFTKGSGLPAPRTSRVFADSRGDLWVGVWDAGRNTVVRRDGGNGSFEWIPTPESWGPGRVPESFAEDARGTIWIGFFEGGIARYRGGRIEAVANARRHPGMTPHIRALHLDAQGRLWFAAEQEGLGRIDDPGAEHPTVRLYTKQDGLASDNVRCVTEDESGRIYAGTQLGVDRLEPTSGLVRRFASDDGLARGEVEVCTRAAGRLWFGTARGLSSFRPAPEPKAEPPAVFIEAVQVAGVARPVSWSGETDVDGLELPFPGQLQIEFASVGFRPGRGIRYQYRLEGADSDWGPFVDDRSVHFASLGGGAYRFLVRAVSAEGLVSDRPASVRFRVVPPLWRRPAFIALVAALGVLGALAFVRYRVAMLLELERVRTRIASDLHDDIGASLSQIAVLGEVARTRLDGDHPEVTEPLAQIGTLSREAVDAMGDIVWAINPARDRFPDLAHRMRRLASDLLPGRGIAFAFRAEEPGRDPRLGADLRREVFLVYKEALHNLMRHSGCTQAVIEMHLERSWLTLTVKDDGRGLEAARAGDGHGLQSMRRRAEGLGGTLQIVSRGGTTVVLRVPLKSRPRRGTAASPHVPT